MTFTSALLTYLVFGAPFAWFSAQSGKKYKAGVAAVFAREKEEKIKNLRREANLQIAKLREICSTIMRDNSHSERQHSNYEYCYTSESEDDHAESSADESSDSRSNSPYQVLGIPENSPIDIVSARYKLLSKQYHPDMVENLGEELKVVADRKMKEINSAYSSIKKRAA